jgi:DNA-binding response OmpR family regulator
MFNAETATLQRIAPKMQRVLIVDPHVAAARQLSDLLRDIAPCQVWTASDIEQGLILAGRIDPHLILVEQSPALNGVAFTRSLRRGYLACRKAPVIMLTAEATAAVIVAARDAGVHEFLRRPCTLGDLARRIEAVTLRVRDWVEGVSYVGPDRRRFNSGDYAGPLKREADGPVTPDAAKVSQALKIFRAAAHAAEKDPDQALRAMLAQASDLQSAALALSDCGLYEAAADVQVKLLASESLIRRELDAHIAELWRFMPSHNDGAAVAA